MLFCLFLLAIDIADYISSKNLVKSLFIKMKAIQGLGDYVPALRLAVWCKYLRPVSYEKPLPLMIELISIDCNHILPINRK